VFAEPSLGQAALVIRRGVFGIEANRLGKILDRLVEPAKRMIGAAALAVGVGVFPVEPDGFVVVFDRALVLLELFVGVAAVVISLRELWIQLDRLLVIFDGPLLPPQSGVSLAPADVSPGEAGIGFDDLVVRGDRLADFPGAVQLQRLVVGVSGFAGRGAIRWNRELHNEQSRCYNDSYSHDGCEEINLRSKQCLSS